MVRRFRRPLHPFEGTSRFEGTNDFGDALLFEEWTRQPAAVHEAPPRSLAAVRGEPQRRVTLLLTRAKP
jgi:hypothetical protein